MDNGLLQALLMAQAGQQSGQMQQPFQQQETGGMNPQVLQFAAGAFNKGGFQAGMGRMLGSMLAQRMRQQSMEQNTPTNELY